MVAGARTSSLPSPPPKLETPLKRRRGRARSPQSPSLPPKLGGRPRQHPRPPGGPWEVLLAAIRRATAFFPEKTTVDPPPPFKLRPGEGPALWYPISLAWGTPWAVGASPGPEARARPFEARSSPAQRNPPLITGGVATPAAAAPCGRRSPTELQFGELRTFFAGGASLKQQAPPWLQHLRAAEVAPPLVQPPAPRHFGRAKMLEALYEWADERNGHLWQEKLPGFLAQPPPDESGERSRSTTCSRPPS